MEVQVRHTLAAVCANIGDDAVSAFLHAQFAAQFRNDGKDVTYQRAILLRQGRRRTEVLFRDYQKMHRGLGIDVVTRQKTGAWGSMS